MTDIDVEAERKKLDELAIRIVRSLERGRDHCWPLTLTEPLDRLLAAKRDAQHNEGEG